MEDKTEEEIVKEAGFKRVETNNPIENNVITPEGPETKEQPSKFFNNNVITPEEEVKFKAAMEETNEALKNPETKEQLSKFFKEQNSMENRVKDLEASLANGEIAKDEFDICKKVNDTTTAFQAGEKKFKFGKKF